ncbi:MAG: hypothetical protein R2909_07850 [Gemmatimonadales bacterium]
MTAGLAAAPWLSLPRSRRPSADWDLGWLDDLTGIHRQVFDVGPVQHGLLHVAKNWLNAHNEVFGLRDDQLSAVVGLAARGFPANAGDPLWERYPIGEQYGIVDPATREPARRSPFVHAEPGSDDFEESVPELVRRGVIFWQCNNALHGVAERLARATKQDHATVYQDLRANLLPHVKLVPAHTMLVGLCQERGCTYEALV